MNNFDHTIAPRTSGGVSVPTFANPAFSNPAVGNATALADAGLAARERWTIAATDPRVADMTAKRNPGTQAWSPPT